MRVLFINQSFPNPVEPNRGNFVLKNICAYSNDVEVTVVAPVPFGLSLRRGHAKKSSSKSKQDPYLAVPYEEIIRCGERIIRVIHPRFVLLPRNILRQFVPYLEYILIRKLVHSLYKSWNPDLIHANFASPDGIAAARLSKDLHIPLVITEHQAALESFLKIGYLRRQMLAAYQQAKKVICVSEHTMGIIRKADPSLQNLLVIPNGVDFSRFSLRSAVALPKQMSAAEGKALLKLIYIGYLIPHKGVQVLLKALAILRKESLTFSLTIVGDGFYKAELMQMCHNLNLTEQVKFAGEKNAAEVAELLSQHDAMVHPSFMESFGIVLVEALASGLPVVSTYNGGAEGILSPETGILVQPNNPPALAEGIKELVAKWESYLPEKLRSEAEKRFSITTVAEQTINVYGEVT